jgi:hypothetical protein
MTLATWIKSALLTLLLATTSTANASYSLNPVVTQVNRLRARHGADPVAYSETICTSAQAWADHLGHSGALAHSDGVYGENLAYYGGQRTRLTNITSAAMLTSAVDMWYSEIDLYDFKHPAFSPSTAHFTQLVWQGSTEIGYGLTQVGTSVYIVMQFYKRGNVNARFEANVFPLRNISIPTPMPQPPMQPPMQPLPQPPMQPMQPMQPLQPMQPAQPMQPVEPVPQPMQPAQPMQPVEPVPQSPLPQQPMQPAQPVQPVEPMTPHDVPVGSSGTVASAASGVALVFWTLVALTCVSVLVV